MRTMIKSLKHYEAERRLWCAVLSRALHDITHEPEYSRHRKRAISWVGTYPSSAFIEVCRFAGFEPEAVWPRLKRLCTPERAKE